MKEIAIAELQRKLEVAQKEKDGIQLTIEKLKNASKRNFMPLKPDLLYTGLDEFVVKLAVENKSNDEEENVTQPKIVKKIFKPNIVKKEFVKPRQQEKTARKTVKKLKELMKIIPDEKGVAIDAIPLAVKSPMIIDWKIHKEGNKSYYQIIIADGNSKMYIIFNRMLKEFDREDLEDMYNLVKAKYRSTRLVEYLDLLLWSDLKAMFKPHVEDQV
nr:hypothetical protein [Tanacetum cinerariifolium]